HRHHRLDPAVQVAWHQVRGADEMQLLAGAPTVGEAVDARVLQVAPDDRADGDVVRQAGDTGADAGDPPHDQLDPHAVLGRRVQLVDQVRVDQAVHLHDDVAGAGRRGPLVADEADQPVAQGVRRHQQLGVVDVSGVAGQVV